MTPSHHMICPMSGMSKVDIQAKNSNVHAVEAPRPVESSRFACLEEQCTPIPAPTPILSLRQGWQVIGKQCCVLNWTNPPRKQLSLHQPGS
ncbi:hypothetical protein ROHU_026335 [Labeo rohita]|uniref:Uncharacterized protein n=1 Tax=Labeo rohita TaxID=84645 RepID=A0A498MBA7_LABRO|nr:hypothetical protein ROHU_026335 [Labeo rohita]